MTTGDSNVVRLPVPDRHPRTEDPLKDARELLADWDAQPGREKNYRSSMYADLAFDCLRRMLPAATVLCPEAQEVLEHVYARAYARALHGEDLAGAYAAEVKPLLRLLEGGEHR